MLYLILALGLVGSTPASAVLVQDEPLHRVVYAGKALRVLDVVIPPHRSTLYHVHVNDMVVVTLAPGPTRDEKAGAASVDEPPDKPGAVWLAVHPQRDVHRVTNLGDSEIHMVAVELLSSERATDTARRDAIPEGVVQLENSKTRVVRYSLRPGQAIKLHSHRSYVLVALGPGRLSGICGRSDSHFFSGPGYLCVAAKEGHNQIANIGANPFELLAFAPGRSTTLLNKVAGFDPESLDGSADSSR